MISTTFNESGMPSKKDATILVVDDERFVRQSLKMILNDHYEVLLAASSQEAVFIFSQNTVDVILLDIQLPDADGVELIDVLKDMDPYVEIIMVTANKEVQKVVQAMKAGAFDYMAKPFIVEDIQIAVSHAVEKRGLMRQINYLKGELQRVQHFERMVGADKKMLEIYDLISKVAGSGGAVLIQGESGTGKELVARAIHNVSPRKEHPFVVINCAAIPSTLMESEIFGHTRGAFTGATNTTVGKLETGNNGTVFLDDVDTLDLAMQAKLLRVIQEREFERLGSTKLVSVDIRFVASSNKPIDKLIKEGRFREDLYYRLNVFPIYLPPLRERISDLPILLDHFSRVNARNTGSPPKSFSPAAICKLNEYDWPGNVRELQNLVERLSVIVREPVIEPHHLACLQPDRTENCVLALKDAVRSFERRYIMQVLEQSGGNRKAAAEILGVHRNTLLGKIQQLGL